jgi:hypothetical protein
MMSLRAASHIASNEGALYQAFEDTAQTPAVARAGRHGVDGRTSNVRGTYDAYGD